MDLGNMFKQFSNMQGMMDGMQNSMKQAKDEVDAVRVVGQAGVSPANVKLILRGNKDCERVSFGTSFSAQPQNIQEELIAAAINDGMRRLEEATQKKMMEVAQNIKIPGMDELMGQMGGMGQMGATPPAAPVADESDVEDDDEKE